MPLASPAYLQRQDRRCHPKDRSHLEGIPEADVVPEEHPEGNESPQHRCHEQRHRHDQERFGQPHGTMVTKWWWSLYSPKCLEGVFSEVRKGRVGKVRLLPSNVNRDVLVARLGQRLPMPSSPSLVQFQARQAGHEIQLRRPRVPQLHWI